MGRGGVRLAPRQAGGEARHLQNGAAYEAREDHAMHRGGALFALLAWLRIACR